MEESLNSGPQTLRTTSGRIRAITISGEVSSGKTSLAYQLCELLNDNGIIGKWRVVGVGKMFRDFCAEQGISTDTAISQVPDYIHRQFDSLQKNVIVQEQKIIVDGRLSGYFAQGLKDVLKIYCKLSKNERIFRYAQRQNTELEKAESDLLYRDIHDLEKYRTLYQIKDYRDDKYYDMILDTKIDVLSLARLVLENISSRL